jgi:hypothetical protein
VIATVKSFFYTGKLIKEANSTNLTLVPKKATPSARGTIGLFCLLQCNL